MSKTVLYMSMSLDGCIAGPRDRLGNGLGDDGARLHDWLWTDAEPGGTSGVPGRPAGASGEVFDEMMASGAVLTGRRTFEMAGGWQGDHHGGVPIFVLTSQPGPDSSGWPLVSYVRDIATAVDLAKAAAGGRDVLVHGARTAQLALQADLLDEIQIHLIPVLLGAGRRLFDNAGHRHYELELRQVVEAPGVTHLRYRVSR